jgi:hypothetical protein
MISIEERQQIAAEPAPLTLRYRATDEDLPAELFNDAEPCSTTDKKVLTGPERSSKVSKEVPMAKQTKQVGRPRRGEELIEYRVSTVLTKQEKEALDKIANDKRWSMATLIRDLLEKNYPEAFKKEAPKK